MPTDAIRFFEEHYEEARNILAQNRVFIGSGEDVLYCADKKDLIFTGEDDVNAAILP